MHKSLKITAIILAIIFLIAAIIGSYNYITNNFNGRLEMERQQHKMLVDSLNEVNNKLNLKLENLMLNEDSLINIIIQKNLSLKQLNIKYDDLRNSLNQFTTSQHIEYIKQYLNVDTPYPQMMVINGDSLIVFTISQLENINEIIVNREELHETVLIQMETIENYEYLTSNLNSQIGVWKNLHGNVLIENKSLQNYNNNLENETKFLNKQLKNYKWVVRIVGGVAIIVGAITVVN